MRKEFLKHLWILTGLRYRLVWAQARTSNGGILLLLSLYLLGGSVALLLAFGGLGAAIADSDLEQNGRVARLILTTLFVNGIGLSLMLGLGTLASFSEESMRRYPLSARERFLVRRLIGLLDPIWALMAFGALGLAIGFSWFGKGTIILGAPAAAMFITASYLATVCLLSIIGHIMRSRVASTALGVVALALVSFGPLAMSVVAISGGDMIWDWGGRILRLTPPGAAAAMMMAENRLEVFGAAVLLILWIGALTWVLSLLERLPRGVEARDSRGISWDNFYDQIAGLFGRKYAPFISKSLRYHLRCNVVRFSLLTAPVLALLGKFMGQGRFTGGASLISLWLFFIISSAVSASMMLNLFGYDGAGIRRYAILPSTFTTALRANSLASLLLRAVVLLAAIALWVTFAQTRFDARLLLMLLGIVGSGLFLFNAMGLWTSVLSAKCADFDAMWNNRLSFGANLALVCGFVPYLIAMIFSDRFDPSDLLRYWWAPLPMVILCAGFYLVSMIMIEPVLNWRREKLIRLIAGARDN